MKHYILNDDHSIKEVSLFEWAEWFETHDNERRVDYTTINEDVRVSTVFLGIDHNFFDSGQPVLFETMIFGGPLDGDQYRYCTYDEAKIGHAEAVKMALEEAKNAT